MMSTARRDIYHMRRVTRVPESAAQHEVLPYRGLP
jgi:hypothetical protein